MKTIIVSCAAILSWATLFAQQKNNMATDISGVTLYSDRAEVTRSAEMTLYEGEYELTVKDLPYALLDQSLRVNGSGTASAKITDIKIETDYIDTLPTNRLKDLQEQLASIVSEEKIYTDRLSLLAKEKELLELIKLNVTGQGKDKETPKPTFEDWNKLFLFYDSNVEKLNVEIRSLEKKKSDMNAKKSNLQNQINQLSGYSRSTKKKIVLSVSVGKAGTMKFDLAYVIAGARWYPVYDVRVSPDDKNVEFVYYAMISQTTGEDWKNVTMAISTARPNISGSMPQLSAWYLSVYNPNYYGSLDGALDQIGGLGAASGAGAAKSAMRSGKKSDKAYEAEVAKEEMQALQVENALVETKSTSVVFKIGKRATIPSDNFDHKVLISVASLKSEFAYSTAPKLAELAYLKAQIENTTDVPFIAGQANVFFGNSFVGTSRMNTVIPTEKFNVFLGIDEGIRVKREQVKDYQAEKGFFSKSTKKSFEYKITIESFKKTEDTITVQDQWPVSQDERIKIEAVLPEFEKDKSTALHPNGVIEKKGNGIVEWRLRIKPKQKIELRIKYNVEYGKDIQIDGL